MRALLFLGICVIACSSDTNKPPVVAPMNEPAPPIVLVFSTPLDGDLAEPGENVDVTVHATAVGVSPTLLVNDVETPVTWTADASDASVLHAPFAIPADANGALHFDAVADNCVPASADLSIVAPAAKSGAVVAANMDTIVTLASGAKLTIPMGALPNGTIVELAAYPPSTLPYFSALVTSIYRVHLSVDEAQISGSFWLEEPLTAPAITGFGAQPHLSLDFYEGSDPDSEGAPISMHPQLAVAMDGSGSVRSELPPRAFHHTGSTAAIMGLENSAYPFVFDSPKVCASDDADMSAPNCQPLARTYGGASTPNVTLPCPAMGSVPHVNVTGAVKWTDVPPAFVSPLDDAAALMSTPSPPYATDIMNPLRKHPTKPVWRFHEGADLRAKPPWPDPNATGWPLYAAISGRARAHMQSEYTLDINNGNGGCATCTSAISSASRKCSRRMRCSEKLCKR